MLLSENNLTFKMTVEELSSIDKVLIDKWYFLCSVIIGLVIGYLYLDAACKQAKFYIVQTLFAK